jgi:GAF domain-containing protein
MAETVPRPTAAALRRQVAAICALGNRFVGSPGERAARDYVCAELERAGVPDLRVEEFEVLGYRPGSASCVVQGVADGELPAVGLQFTAVGEIEAEAVYLGNPRTIDDIVALEAAGVSLAGKAAVVDSYWPYRLADHVVQAGAAALIVVSPNVEGLMTHFTAQLYPPAEGGAAGRRPLAIPGVTIERRAASGLLALMADRRCTLRIAHDATYAPVRTANVVAEIPGTELPDERVVLGGHYDTQLEGVGACDNATGVAATIELARACVAQPRRRTMTFVAFGDEEHGFHGGIDYCRRHAATLDRTLGMICLDALAWVYPGSRSLHADPSFQAYASARATEVGWEPEEVVDASLLLGSDHNAFIDAGVPAAWFWRYPPQHFGYHSTGDAIELVDFALVAETCAAAGHTAFSLADEPGLPLGRSRPTRRWHDLRGADAADPSAPPRFDELIERLHRACGAGRTTLRLRSDAAFFPVVAEARADGVKSVAGVSAESLEQAPTFRHLADALELLVQHDCLTSEVPTPAEVVELYGVKAQVLVPIVIEQELHGAISVHETRAPRRWTQEEIDLAVAAAADVKRSLEASTRSEVSK